MHHRVSHYSSSPQYPYIMTQLKPIDGTTVYLWKYLPLILLAIVAIILFSLVTTTHSYRVIYSSTWFYIPLLIGGSYTSIPSISLFISRTKLTKYASPPVQILGYTLRILSHYTTNEISPYIIQSIFILLAPVFYTATIYISLSRLITSIHGEHFSTVPPRKTTKRFVLSDVISLAIQGNTAGLTGKKKTQTIGHWWNRNCMIDIN